MEIVKESQAMRRSATISMLLAIVLLSACAPTPEVIVQQVPQTVIVTAVVVQPTVAPPPEPTPRASATTLPTPSQATLFNAVVTGDLLNLRSQPRVDSETMGVLDKGCELQAIARTPEGDWLKVEFHGMQGWVAAPYVELSVPLDAILVVGEVPTPESGTPGLRTERGASAQVLRVIDGHAIEVSIDTQTYTVRYLGIEAPQLVRPELSVDSMAIRAAAQNEAFVGGKTVVLEKDVLEVDEQGNLLRYVWAGDLMVNAELVRLGYAQVGTYPPHVKYQDLLLELEGEARDAGRGLWATPAAVSGILTTVTPSSTMVFLPQCPNPSARVTHPAQNATVKGVVEVRGSADIADLSYYKFELRAEGGHEWAFLYRSDTPVRDGVLGYWDTAALPGEWYDFRLVVVDNTGNYPQPCEVRLRVEH
jgi:micrococcal nuclease